MSANYEHLLPDERVTLLPLLWSVLRPGGVLFLDQTPHRFFPVEGHTTGLPLINYLPDALAHRFARLSERVQPDEDWDTLLRRGIRGGTTGQIVRLLGTEGGKPVVMNPEADAEIRDRIDLWFRMSTGHRPSPAKTAIRLAAKGLRGVTGVTLVPTLSLAIRKGGPA